MFTNDKTAIIGNGYWSKKIQQYIYNQFDVKYIADSKFDLNQIWEDKEIKSVFIISPIDSHYSITLQAIQHEKHVLVEKPIALTFNDAHDLKIKAEKKEIQLAVDYTMQFSQSIKKAVELKDSIGEIEYIEMSTKHLGRFMDFDVYWLLASHHLSILDMFFPLDSFNYSKENLLFHNDLCTTGILHFWNDKGLQGRIDISTNFPGKEMMFTIYGEEGTIQYNALSENPLVVTWYEKNYKELPDKLITKQEKFNFNEKHNLKNMVEYFYNVIHYKEKSNIQTAIEITKILEEN